MRDERVRLALFVLAVAGLAAAFAALVRHDGFRSPLGVIAVLGVELAAIAVAVGFHVAELRAAEDRRGAAKEAA